jgi:hypothetical protein
MSKGPAKDPNRVQLRLPDDILNTLTAPQLGTKLKQYLNNGIELSAPLVAQQCQQECKNRDPAIFASC